MSEINYIARRQYGQRTIHITKKNSRPPTYHPPDIILQRVIVKLNLDDLFVQKCHQRAHLASCLLFASPFQIRRF